MGDSWTTSREEARHQPQLLPTNIDFSQPYVPAFYDGWTPSMSALDINNDLSRLAFSTAAQIQQQQQHHSSNTGTGSSGGGHHHQHHHQNGQHGNHANKSGVSHMTTSSSNNTTMSSKNSGGIVAAASSSKTGKPASSNLMVASTTATNVANENKSGRTNDDMKKWAVDLVYRGVKVYEVCSLNFENLFINIIYSYLKISYIKS